jgi:hypothetical protein
VINHSIRIKRFRLFPLGVVHHYPVLHKIL